MLEDQILRIVYEYNQKEVKDERFVSLKELEDGKKIDGVFASKNQYKKELYESLNALYTNHDIQFARISHSNGIVSSEFDFLATNIKPIQIPFRIASTSSNLIDSLTEEAARSKENEYVFHHTTISAFEKIVSSKMFYVGSPKNMNDKYEYKKFDEGLWNNIFFISFMKNFKENVGMWSMYSQPWPDGISIGIRMVDLLKWLDEIKEVYEADLKKRAIKDHTINIGISKKFHGVGYVEEDAAGNPKSLYCQNHINTVYKIKYDKDTVGYLKNSACQCENEFRFRIELDYPKIINGICVEIPDYVFKNMIVTKGPRFNGFKNEIVIKKINVLSPSGPLTYVNSILTDKLSWVYCDSCEIKKRLEKPIKKGKNK